MARSPEIIRKFMGDEPIRREHCQYCAGDDWLCPCEDFEVGERVQVAGSRVTGCYGHIQSIPINVSRFMPVGFWVRLEEPDEFRNTVYMFRGDEIVHDGDLLPDTCQVEFKDEAAESAGELELRDGE